jgi:hypothetical protein
MEAWRASFARLAQSKAPQLSRQSLCCTGKHFRDGQGVVGGIDHSDEGRAVAKISDCC